MSSFVSKNAIAKRAQISLAPASLFAGEARSANGGLVRRSPRGGFMGAEPADAGEVFKNFVK